MAKVSIVEALADCLETMRQGANLELCLERYPEYRLELRALLEVVALIRPLPQDAVPSRDFREATKSRIVDAGGVPHPYPLGEDTPQVF